MPVGMVTFEQVYERVWPSKSRLPGWQPSGQPPRPGRDAPGPCRVAGQRRAYAAFLRVDWRFHLAVAGGAKNVILAQMYTLAHGLLDEMLELTVLQPGGKARGVHFQGELLEAIAAHDPERAGHSAQQHMDCFWAIGARLPDRFHRPTRGRPAHTGDTHRAACRNRREVIAAPWRGASTHSRSQGFAGFPNDDVIGSPGLGGRRMHKLIPNTANGTVRAASRYASFCATQPFWALPSRRPRF